MARIAVSCGPLPPTFDKFAHIDPEGGDFIEQEADPSDERFGSRYVVPERLQDERRAMVARGQDLRGKGEKRQSIVGGVQVYEL